jgi:cholesterol 7-dehydrogenase
VGAIVLYQLYAFLFRPLRLVRQPQEIGYLPKEKQSTEQRMAQVSKRRMVGDLPPVYPNGWYELMRASDLHNGVRADGGWSEIFFV